MGCLSGFPVGFPFFENRATKRISRPKDEGMCDRESELVASK